VTNGRRILSGAWSGELLKVARAGNSQCLGVFGPIRLTRSTLWPAPYNCVLTQRAHVEYPLAGKPQCSPHELGLLNCVPFRPVVVSLENGTSSKETNSYHKQSKPVKKKIVPNLRQARPVIVGVIARTRVLRATVVSHPPRRPP